MLLDQAEQFLFGLTFDVGSHRDVYEGNPVSPRQGLHVAVVGHNQWDVDWQLSGAPPVQEVVEAMTESGDEDRYALPVVDGRECPLDTEVLCDARKLSLEKSLGELEVVEANLDPHEEALCE